MADIGVTRRGPGVWAWVLGLLLLALVVWGAAELPGGEEPVVADRVEAVGTRPAPPAEGVPLVST